MKACLAALKAMRSLLKTETIPLLETHAWLFASCWGSTLQHHHSLPALLVCPDWPFALPVHRCGQMLVNLIGLDWFAFDSNPVGLWTASFVGVTSSDCSSLRYVVLASVCVLSPGPQPCWIRKMLSYLLEQMLGTYCIHGVVLIGTAIHLT